MTRPINAESVEQERRIKDAIEGVQSVLHCTSRTERLPGGTLSQRLSISCRIARKLSEEEETELPRWICQFTMLVHPPKPYAVREIAAAIQLRRVVGINNPSVSPASYDAIGEQWVKQFLN